MDEPQELCWAKVRMALAFSGMAFLIASQMLRFWGPDFYNIFHLRADKVLVSSSILFIGISMVGIQNILAQGLTRLNWLLILVLLTCFAIMGRDWVRLAG